MNCVQAYSFYQQSRSGKVGLVTKYAVSAFNLSTNISQLPSYVLELLKSRSDSYGTYAVFLAYPELVDLKPVFRLLNTLNICFMVENLYNYVVRHFVDVQALAFYDW